MQVPVLIDQRNKLLWEEAKKREYNMLNKVVTQRPILHIPDHSKQCILRTDASGTGVGALLLQEQGEHAFHIRYASKKLSPREKIFSAIEKEC